MSVIQISVGQTTKLPNVSIDGSSSEVPFERLGRGWGVVFCKWRSRVRLDMSNLCVLD